MSGAAGGAPPANFTFQYTDPVGHGTGRPYLWLRLHGHNGNNGPVLGLIDSGADQTMLPMDYIALMGYGQDDLELSQAEAADGPMDIWRAKRPCTAEIINLTQPHFELWPWFGETDGALWGRRDFMVAYSVMFNERAQTFTIVETP